MLEVTDLSVQLQTQRGPAFAIRNVGFALQRGDTLGLVGESGCGKSITAMALMGLLPEHARVTGSVRFDGQELVGKSDAVLRRLRGNRIGMIFQEPMTALNPVHTIGHQVAEPMRLHRGVSRTEARRQTIVLLERVGIGNAAGRVDTYPHQFSGGQRQRITIAMALACGPELLIADEPTTALDVTIQGQILDLIHDLVTERAMGLLLISHDLGVIAQNVSRMMVMYGGSVIESGSTQRVFGHMAHPYTRGLFGARPRLGAPAGTRLTTIDGTVPELVDLPTGCAFSDRCAWVRDSCRTTRPEAIALEPGHAASCLRLDAVLAADAP